MKKEKKRSKRSQEIGERMDFLEKRMVERVYKTNKVYSRKPKHGKNYEYGYHLKDK